MHTTVSTVYATDFVARLRRVLFEIELDRIDSAALEGALARFTSLEYRRNRRTALTEARRQRDWIIAKLAFLSELDEISDQEADCSVFEEVALLFEEIGSSSVGAAEVIRSVAQFATETMTTPPVGPTSMSEYDHCERARERRNAGHKSRRR